MINNSIIQLENGKTYVVVDKIEKLDIAYVYLANIENQKDFCVRKEITDNNEVYLTGLDNSQEFDEAMNLFIKKNNQEA